MENAVKITRSYPFLALLLVSVSGQHISCAISGNINQGDPVSVTCDYHKDLEKYGLGFYVYRYPSDGGDPDLPAICDWENVYLRCDVSSGYKVRLDGHKMTLNISAAEETHTGRYACHVLQPDDDTEPGQCDLVIHKRKNSEQIDCHAMADPSREESATIMCFVSHSFHDANVTLERQGPSQTMSEEIMRCNIRTNMCETRIFGYQVGILESTSTGFKVMVAVVNGAGLYTCRVHSVVAKNQLKCSRSVEKDVKLENVRETSAKQSLEVTVLAILLALVLIIFGILFGYCYYKRRLHHQKINFSDESTISRFKSISGYEKATQTNSSDTMPNERV